MTNRTLFSNSSVQTCEVAFGRRPILTVSLSDGTSKIMLRFFNFNAGMKNSFQIGTRVKAFGEIKRGALYGGNSSS